VSRGGPSSARIAAGVPWTVGAALGAIGRVIAKLPTTAHRAMERCHASILGCLAVMSGLLRLVPPHGGAATDRDSSTMLAYTRLCLSIPPRYRLDDDVLSLTVAPAWARSFVVGALASLLLVGCATVQPLPERQATAALQPATDTPLARTIEASTSTSMQAPCSSSRARRSPSLIGRRRSPPRRWSRRGR
jgi:hypothetical protein